MCRMMLGSNPVLLRLWQLGTLIHESNFAESFESLSSETRAVQKLKFCQWDIFLRVLPIVQKLNKWLLLSNYWTVGSDLRLSFCPLWRVIANEWEKVFVWPKAVSRLCWYTQRRMRLSRGELGARGPDCGQSTCAGIFKQSMGARTQLEYGCGTGPPGYIGWRN
jgi:hypothetical protein